MLTIMSLNHQDYGNMELQVEQSLVSGHVALPKYVYISGL